MVASFKRRYVLFKLISENYKPERDEVQIIISNSVQTIFGSYGLSQMNLSLLRYDEKKGVGILRCSHKFLDTVRAALLFATHFKGNRVAILTIRASGTIRSLKNIDLNNCIL